MGRPGRFTSTPARLRFGKGFFGMAAETLKPNGGWRYVVWIPASRWREKARNHGLFGRASVIGRISAGNAGQFGRS
jgi:hypothetical protein